MRLPRLDKTSKSSVWFKALSAAAGRQVFEIGTVELSQLPAWIATRLRRNRQSVSAETLQWLATQFEGNLLAAHQEIQKLGLLYPPGELTPEHIAQAVANVARYDVFKLSEAVLSGNLERTTRMLDGLQAEGVAEVLVHWTLAEDIRNLQRARAALDAGEPLPLVLRQLRIWGKKEQLFAQLLPRLRPARLAKLLLAAHQVDGIVKGLALPGWPAHGWQALHRLAFDMVQAVQSAR